MKDNAINATTGAVEKYFVKLFINFIENNKYCGASPGLGPEGLGHQLGSTEWTQLRHQLWASPQGEAVYL